MKVTHSLRMDLARCGCRPILGAVQGESNTRVLEVSLYDNGIAWVVPETAVVDVAYQKPDGTKGIYSKLPDGTIATSFSGNVLTAILAPQVLTCAGSIRAAFVFTKADQEVLATFPFTIKVEENPAAGAERSEDYFNPADISDLRAEIAAHAARVDNPHRVTAEQVGARPDTWMPTAAEVGARPDTWMPTAAEVGARPSTWTPTAEDVGARPDTWTPTSVDVGAAPAIEDATYAGCYYRMVGGEKEWINPPMQKGAEYRTTDRYNGKPVYKKAISYTLASNVSASGLTDLAIPTGITEFKEPVSYSADLNDSVLLPYVGGTGHVGLVKFEGTTVTLRASNQAMSAGEIVEIRLAYTKTTD